MICPPSPVGLGSLQTQLFFDAVNKGLFKFLAGVPWQNALFAVAVHLEVSGPVFECCTVFGQPPYEFALLHIMLDLLVVERVLL